MNSRKTIFKVLLIILAIAGLCCYLFLGSVTAEIKNGSMVVHGTLIADAEIHYSEMEECLLYDSIEAGMPSIALSNFKVRIGQYSSSQYGPYRLMIYKNVQKYIIIKANDSYVIFNCATPEETVNCFNSIQAALDQLADEGPDEAPEDTTSGGENAPDVENEAPN